LTKEGKDKEKRKRTKKRGGAKKSFKEKNDEEGTEAGEDTQKKKEGNNCTPTITIKSIHDDFVLDYKLLKAKNKFMMSI